MNCFYITFVTLHNYTQNINKMNTSTKLVTLFNEIFDNSIDNRSQNKLKYIFNIVKGKYYKLTIKICSCNIIDLNIILLFDNLFEINYNKNIIKIKTSIHNQITETILIDYEYINENINSLIRCEWATIRTILPEIYAKLITVLENVMNEELTEKEEEQPDLLDLDLNSKEENVKKSVKISGKSYLKSANDLLYDPITEEVVGFWDPITNKVIKANDDSDEEDC